jgi:hypothetical protein
MADTAEPNKYKWVDKPGLSTVILKIKVPMKDGGFLRKRVFFVSTEPEAASNNLVLNIARAAKIRGQKLTIFSPVAFPTEAGALLMPLEPTGSERFDLEYNWLQETPPDVYTIIANESTQQRQYKKFVQSLGNPPVKHTSATFRAVKAKIYELFEQIPSLNNDISPMRMVDRNLNKFQLVQNIILLYRVLGSPNTRVVIHTTPKHIQPVELFLSLSSEEHVILPVQEIQGVTKVRFSRILKHMGINPVRYKIPPFVMRPTDVVSVGGGASAATNVVSVGGGASATARVVSVGGGASKPTNVAASEKQTTDTREQYLKTQLDNAARWLERTSQPKRKAQPPAQPLPTPAMLVPLQTPSEMKVNPLGELFDDLDFSFDYFVKARDDDDEYQHLRGDSPTTVPSLDLDMDVDGYSPTKRAR